MDNSECGEKVEILISSKRYGPGEDDFQYRKLGQVTTKNR